MDGDRVLRTYRVLRYWHDDWEALRYAFLLEDLSINILENSDA